MPIIKRIFPLDIIALFIVLSLVYFKDFFLSCVSYLNLSFDQQIPLTWDFTSLNNVLPYKDIYFPYGILFYFKSNVFLGLINFFLPTILFTSIYIIFKKISENKLLALFSFICFYLFIYKYTGVENFTRYGIILSFSLLFSYIFHKLPLISVRASFLSGILIGGTFSLVHDQGIYGFLLFVFLLLISPILKRVQKLSYLNFLTSRLLTNIVGIAMGFLPFFLFLSTNDITYEFLLFLTQLSDFSLYAKTPFIPFSTTTDNLFTFVGIFIAIVALSYKIFFFQKKISFIAFLEISLVFALILLEQKNIVRSIDKQITFISFFLYLVMFYELIKNKVNNVAMIFCFITIFGIVLSGVGLHGFINYSLHYKRDFINLFFQNNFNDFLKNKSLICLDDNLKKLIIGKNIKFEKIRKIVENDSSGESNIFVYLTDPVFYILFKKTPPYYFTVFEATPLYAQKANIEYIEENRVKYIIYNTDTLRIQDGIPDYIRSRVLYKYVMSNFKVLDRVENYMVFKKI